MFRPTLADLLNVRGFIAREIARLQKRLAEIDKMISATEVPR